MVAQPAWRQMKPSGLHPPLPAIIVADEDMVAALIAGGGLPNEKPPVAGAAAAAATAAPPAPNAPPNDPPPADPKAAAPKAPPFDGAAAAEGDAAALAARSSFFRSPQDAMPRPRRSSSVIALSATALTPASWPACCGNPLCTSQTWTSAGVPQPTRAGPKLLGGAKLPPGDGDAPNPCGWRPVAGKLSGSLIAQLVDSMPRGSMLELVARGAYRIDRATVRRAAASHRGPCNRVASTAGCHQLQPRSHQLQTRSHQPHQPRQPRSHRNHLRACWRRRRQQQQYRPWT